MVYTTRFALSPASIDPGNYQLFAPVLGAVLSHVIEVTINGVLEHDDFWVLPPWLVLDRSKLGYRLERTDKISLRIEYFYKAENPGLLAFLTGCDPKSPDRRRVWLFFDDVKTGHLTIRRCDSRRRAGGGTAGIGPA